jgi:predicted nucleotidyltransferase
MQVTTPQIDAIRNWAASIPEVSAVYLFGSRVKGTARPDSDLDVAIEFALDPTETHLVVLDNQERWRHMLEAATGLDIDFEPMVGDSPCLRRYIADHGVKIFDASGH